MKLYKEASLFISDRTLYIKYNVKVDLTLEYSNYKLYVKYIIRNEFE